MNINFKSNLLRIVVLTLFLAVSNMAAAGGGHGGWRGGGWNGGNHYGAYHGDYYSGYRGGWYGGYVIDSRYGRYYDCNYIRVCDYYGRCWLQKQCY